MAFFKLQKMRVSVNAKFMFVLRSKNAKFAFAEKVLAIKKKRVSKFSAFNFFFEKKHNALFFLHELNSFFTYAKSHIQTGV